MGKDRKDGLLWEGQRSAKRNAKSKPPLIPPWASRGRVVHSTPTGCSGEGLEPAHADEGVGQV